MLFDALIPSLEEVGARFERGDFFVPEMLIAGKAMQPARSTSCARCSPRPAPRPIGTFVMGTVKGDVHDIGKNLVNIMLEGAGFEVIDLGVQVAPEKFIARSRSTSPTSSASPRSSRRRCRCSRRTSTRSRRPASATR
jgi:methanogenic corrinoid protein MtbC1